MKHIFLFILIIVYKCVIGQSNKLETNVDLNYFKETWDAEDLKVTHYRNGKLIEEAKNLTEWSKKQAKESPGLFMKYSLNGQDFFIYNWFAFNDTTDTLMPIGKRMPKKEDTFFNNEFSSFSLDTFLHKNINAKTYHFRQFNEVYFVSNTL
jgi:hypothetical protein